LSEEEDGGMEERRARRREGWRGGREEGGYELREGRLIGSLLLKKGITGLIA
jgi:hypothetical protein